MSRLSSLGAMLLATSVLVAPAALAQTGQGVGQATTSPSPPAPTTTTTPDTATPEAEGEQVDTSTPGADASEDVIVRGRFIPDAVRATPEVLTVLSTADIARSGEGDIAGALTRVTGLSVVGNGFVFVRGLGDRYSSALLNGSPLPSPEPLRRTVPLDIFPTSVVSSALVQKSYSVNYPAEFGGGVINLTTRAIPEESFVTVGVSGGYDTFTTGNLGYVYDGGGRDFLGYDDGTRNVPAFIKNAGTFIPTGQVITLNNAQTSLLQRNNDLPANFSADFSLGHTIDFGTDRLGIIASGSFSNGWRTRDARQQDTTAQSGTPRNDFRAVITDNRAVVNGLLGLGYEFDDQRIRLTNVYIHDTLKQGRLAEATTYNNSSGARRLVQNTNWFERQLFDTQAVGEFKFDRLSIDLRGSYANSRRDSPYERQASYLVDPATGVARAGRDFGAPFTIAFSELDENLYSAQADVAYELDTERPFTVSAGYYYSDTDRLSSRFSFDFVTNTGSTELPAPFNLLRPDFALSDFVLFNACPSIDDGIGVGCVRLRSTSTAAGAAEYDASLRIHAGYAQAEAEALDGLRATIGVRYEDAIERIAIDDPRFPGTSLGNDYWLPAATITYNFAEDMQLRAHFSKTIARPQFRELAPQQFQDFESDRLFFGNPFLVDSELYNLETRFEWFFARDERFTLAGFYKRIDNPIEQVASFPGSDARLQTGFSYAPSARLYGAEVEVQKYLPLDFISGDFFATRRLVAVVNYTYTQSSINASDALVPDVSSGAGAINFQRASRIFRDGAPLTGQSDHLLNLQLGIEDTSGVSQLTLLFTYASERVTNRGAFDQSGGTFLPDIVEKPGIRLDLVGRQGISVAGAEFELKLEARNLTGTRYQEFQQFDNGNRIEVNSYRLGRVFTVGLGVTL